MEQIYHHYTKWEDWKHGMYSTSISCNEVYIARSLRLLTNTSDFAIACNQVVRLWPISTQHNLTNLECNRNAWLGQAACCFVHSVPEQLTRIAWGRMSAAQRLDANKIATFCIKKWENEHIKQKKNQLELFCL